MSKGDKIPYRAALEVAQALETALSFTCERTLIAGSLRRRKSEVGDLELVVMPRLETVTDMFGDIVGQRSMLDEALNDMGMPRTKDGERYKQFVWEGFPVDLFIATRETWGCVATIRTGSALFTHWLVTNRRQGGGCPSHLRFSEGRLTDGVKALDTSEERLLFEALDQDWIEPVDRVDGGDDEETSTALRSILALRCVVAHLSIPYRLDRLLASQLRPIRALVRALAAHVDLLE